MGDVKATQEVSDEVSPLNPFGLLERRVTFAKKDSTIAVFDTKQHTSRISQHFGQFGRDDGEFHRPAGVTVSNLGEIFVADTGNQRIQVFDNNGLFLRSFTTRINGYTQSCPTGIAAVGNMFFVTDQINNAVNMFDFKGRFTGHFGEDTCFVRPASIAVDRTYGVVAVSDQLGVRIFSAKGERRGGGIMLAGHVGPIANEVACNGRGEILVSCWYDHCIKVYDLNSGFKTRIAGRGEWLGRLERPRGVGVDKQGKIVVSDAGNRRVQLFDPRDRLGFCRLVAAPADGLREPYGVQAMADGRFIVVDNALSKVFSVSKSRCEP
ncbi:PREDICTED: tripartite motif-containing protein 3-like [Branchiostoma belcheri]|uniref:Tripartite motif-containing protein 3-like n=1 Tax=Branchiostoma belcheri TaxID=7741 RepID=A0A6P4YTC4_BRABE|nr:PREDICTED: tripartite motif-containing protein 3-like [Branchiostoma belcheri]